MHFVTVNARMCVCARAGERAEARACLSARRNVLRVHAAKPFGECARVERGEQDSDAITADIVRRKSLN